MATAVPGAKIKSLLIGNSSSECFIGCKYIFDYECITFLVKNMPNHIDKLVYNKKKKPLKHLYLI